MKKKGEGVRKSDLQGGGAHEGRQEVGNGRSAATPTLRPGTLMIKNYVERSEDEKRRMMAAGQCFKCGGRGHIAAKCNDKEDDQDESKDLVGYVTFSELD